MQTKSIINFNDIEIEITRKNIKSVRIKVKPPYGTVHVSMPETYKFSELEKLLEAKIDWLQNSIQKIKNKDYKITENYITGSNIYLFGRKYKLEVIEAPKTLVLIDGTENILLYTKPNSPNTLKKKIIENWYREQLSEKLSVLVPLWEEITGLKVNEWQIKKMKSRWGSCHIFKKKIIFNLELVKHSFKEIEYVILHELSHLVVPSHSDKFKAQVAKYMPNWKTYKNKLNNL